MTTASISLTMFSTISGAASGLYSWEMAVSASVWFGTADCGSLDARFAQHVHPLGHHHVMDTHERILDALDDIGVRCWLGGGWAAELQGIEPPRPHHDIDLYLPDTTFAALDRHVLDPRDGAVKHFRGFECCGVWVEVLLMRPGDTGYVTSFFDRYDLVWPEHSLHECNGVRMLTPAALAASRAAFHDMCAALAGYEASLTKRT